MKLSRLLKIFIYIIFYKFLFDISIYIFVEKQYGYIGGMTDFNIWKFMISNFYLLIIFIAIPKNSDRPSSVFLQLHLLIMIVPMLSIYGIQNKSSIFMGMAVFVFLLQIFIIKTSKRLRIIKIKQSRVLLLFILSGMTISVYFSMIRANGIPSLHTLNFLNVYNVRGGVIYPFLMNYLVHWQAKVINPLLITVSYLNKKNKLFWFSVSLQILIYLITAHKSFILIPFAIIIVIKILRKYDFFKIASLGSGLGIVTSLVIYKVFNILMIPFIIIYRLLFLPAQIKFIYYDFFSNNEFLYFSEGTIGKMLGLKFPYEMPTVNMISSIYFSMPNSAANTGYLSDAYANGGFLGMIIISIVLAYLFIVLDSLALKVRKNVVIGLTIFIVLGLNDLGLLTTLLTGGMIFLIIVLYLQNESNLLKISN